MILKTSQDEHPEPVDANRAGHDKEQCRIPRAENIEESDDSARIGHARDREAGSKQGAGQKKKK